MKLIIDIPEEKYKHVCEEQWLPNRLYFEKAIANGTPLYDVKAEIEKNAYPIVHGVNNHEKGMTLYGILQVLDNIGKAEKGGE